MKPIIFSTPMVKAILAGKKTMTRRPLKRQPEKSWGDVYQWHSKGVSICTGCDKLKDSLVDYAPYKPGDVLYGRETWAEVGWGSGHYIYRADDLKKYKDDGKWRPSIHMPREAARIFLKVPDVRAERLQDITIADIFAEGIPNECGDCTLCGDEPWNADCTDYRLAFSKLWNGIYAKKPEYQWSKNPYVWVIAFERVEKP